MTLTPAQNGALKGLVLSLIGAVALYLTDASHLTGFVNPTIATIIVMIASSVESHIKEQSGNGLFGAVKVSSSSS